MHILLELVNIRLVYYGLFSIFPPNFGTVHLILKVRNSTYDRIFQYSVWMPFWSPQSWAGILSYWAGFLVNPSKKNIFSSYVLVKTD